MEVLKTNNGSKKGFFVISLVSMAAAIAVLVAFLTMLPDLNAQYQMYYGVGLSAEIVLNIMYMQDLFFLCMFIALLLVTMFFAGRRDVFARVMIWGMLLLGTLKLANYVGQLFTLSQYGASDIFTFFSAWIQMLCVVVTLIALIAQWDDKNKKIVNTISLIACVVSAIFFVIILVNRDFSQAGSMAEIILVVGTMASLLLIPLYVFCITSSRRLFNRVMYGFTNEEAEVVEEIEDKLEEERDYYETKAIERLENEIAEELKNAFVEEVIETSQNKTDEELEEEVVETVEEDVEPIVEQEDPDSQEEK